MAAKLLVSTRKGLFEVGKRGSAWQITSTAFLGDNVDRKSVV